MPNGKTLLIESRLSEKHESAETGDDGHCRIRQGHADANFSIRRRAALSLLKNETTLKVDIKNKRLTAGWDESYLEKVLIGS